MEKGRCLLRSIAAMLITPRPGVPREEDGISLLGELPPIECANRLGPYEHAIRGLARERRTFQGQVREGRAQRRPRDLRPLACSESGSRSRARDRRCRYRGERYRRLPAADMRVQPLASRPEPPRDVRLRLISMTMAPIALVASPRSRP